MKALLLDFWNTLFPRTCLTCRERVLLQEEQNVCTYCRSALPQTDYHLYPADNPLYQKLAPHLPIRYAMAYLLFTKSGRTQQLLHNIKYKNQPELAEELGRWYGRLLTEQLYQQQIDALVPVPLHTDRLRRRGYNQSRHFAQGLGAVLGIPVWSDLLLRQRASATQTRKSRLLRWQNVEDIFSVQQPEQLAEKRIAVVDDIITTGATTGACAKALLTAGCAEIDCLALATA